MKICALIVLLALAATAGCPAQPIVFAHVRTVTLQTSPLVPQSYIMRDMQDCGRQLLSFNSNTNAAQAFFDTRTGEVGAVYGISLDLIDTLISLDVEHAEAFMHWKGNLGKAATERDSSRLINSLFSIPQVKDAIFLASGRLRELIEINTPRSGTPMMTHAQYSFLADIDPLQQRIVRARLLPSRDRNTHYFYHTISGDGDFVFGKRCGTTDFEGQSIVATGPMKTFRYSINEDDFETLDARTHGGAWDIPNTIRLRNSLLFCSQDLASLRCTISDASNASIASYDFAAHLPGFDPEYAIAESFFSVSDDIVAVHLSAARLSPDEAAADSVVRVDKLALWDVKENRVVACGDLPGGEERRFHRNFPPIFHIVSGCSPNVIRIVRQNERNMYFEEYRFTLP
jgi:hypothetical protein